MYQTHIRALLWKDFRQQRGFLIAAAVLLVIPYLVASAALIINQLLGKDPVDEWIRFYYAAGVADFGLASVLVAFFSGNAIAGERADRSSEFIAYLPVERRTSVLSKALVALGISVSLLGMCIAILYILAVVYADYPGPPERQAMYMLLGICALMFGVAWLVSSFARSGTYAAACGVCVAVGVGIVLALLAQTETVRQSAPREYLFNSALGLLVAIGVCGFIAGTVCYLRRVES